MGETDEDASAASAAPVLEVVQGDATSEEVAALVTVFSALAGGQDAPTGRRAPREWNAPHRLVQRPHLFGPGGWRSSGLPR